MHEYMQRVLKISVISTAVLFMRENKRRIVMVAGISAAVLFVLVAGLVVYLKSLDFNDYKPQIQQAVQQATGRTLSVDGNLALSVSLHPALVVDGLHLSNARGGSRADMASVERLELELRLFPLLFGEVYVQRLVLVRPDILLETLPGGGNNWNFAPIDARDSLSGQVEAPEAAPDSGPTALGSLPQVHSLLMRDASLTYRDAAKGSVRHLVIPKFRVWQRGSGADEPLHLNVSAGLGKLPLEMSGTIGSVSTLLDNEPLPLDIQVSTTGAAVRVNGRVDRPLEGSGLALNVRLDAPGMGGLARELGLPTALDVALNFAAQLKDDADGYALQDIVAGYGESDASGSVHLALPGGRPKLTVRLNSKQISLIGLQSGESANESQKPSPDKSGGGTSSAADRKSPARVLSAEPLDLDALNSIDADASWQIKRFIMPGMQLSNVDVSLGLDHGVLRVSPFKADVGGGSLHANLTLRGNTSPARLDLRLTGRKIVAGELLAAMGGKPQEALMQGGSMDIDVILVGSGTSMAGLMAGSNGRIKLRMGEGKVKSTALGIVGGDVLMSLADKLNPFSEKKDSMNLKCGVVHFRIENGLMLSEDGIAFETARMNILSEGTINLHDESIDLSIGTEPRDGVGVNLSNMVNVVRLGGTLAEPGIEVDAAKTGMAAARTAGAVMTGGLSLLGEGLFNRATADSSPCKTALEMK